MGDPGGAVGERARSVYLNGWVGTVVMVVWETGDLDTMGIMGEVGAWRNFRTREGEGRRMGKPCLIWG